MSVSGEWRRFGDFFADHHSRKWASFTSQGNRDVEIRSSAFRPLRDDEATTDRSPPEGFDVRPTFPVESGREDDVFTAETAEHAESKTENRFRVGKGRRLEPAEATEPAERYRACQTKDSLAGWDMRVP
jgi:hypothetical protein